MKRNEVARKVMVAAHQLRKGGIAANMSQALKMAWANVKGPKAAPKAVQFEAEIFGDDKPWAAEIKGVGGKYGFEREFVKVEDGRIIDITAAEARAAFAR